MAIERVDGIWDDWLVGWAFENYEGDIEQYIVVGERLEVCFNNSFNDTVEGFSILPHDIDNMITVLQKAKEYFNGQR